MNEASERAGNTPPRDVAVVGAGPAGIAAALALAEVGANVALIGPAPRQADTASRETRTAALLSSSVDLLKALQLWHALAPHAAPLEGHPHHRRFAQPDARARYRVQGERAWP